MIALLTWSLLTAQAHPFGARFAAHAMQLEVHPHQVQLTYLADVPNPLVVSATSDRQADPVEQMALELLSGLVLEIDGASVPLQPVGSWSVRPTEDTHQFQWVLTAPVQRLPVVIELSNGNLPDVTAVFRSEVVPTDGLVVTANTLWRMDGDTVALDESGRWRANERMRTLRVEVAATPVSLRLPLLLLAVAGLLAGGLVLGRHRA